MRVAVVGPGALGCLLTSRISPFLRDSDQSLWLLDHRQERAELLQRSGILLEEDGLSVRHHVSVTAKPAEIGPCNTVFLCVKAPAVDAALDFISPLLTEQTLLIAMQNGIRHLDAIRSAPAAPAAAVSSEGATLVANGHVRHAGAGTTYIGLLTDGRKAAVGRLAMISLLLNSAGLQTQIVDDITSSIWAKLFVNVGINALSALHGQPNGYLLTRTTLRKTMRKAVQEAVQVARKKNIRISGDPVCETFRVCRRTAANISSMLQDVRKKRATEIDAINGAIVRQGRHLAVPTPVNEELVQRIRDLEASWRPGETDRK